MLYASVQVYTSLTDAVNEFYYIVPENLTIEICRGDIVVIPFSTRIITGVVIKLFKNKPESNLILKEIIRILPYQGILGPTFFKLLDEINTAEMFPFSYTIYDTVPSWMMKPDKIPPVFQKNITPLTENLKHYLNSNITSKIYPGLSFKNKLSFISNLLTNNSDKQIIIVSNNYMLLDAYYQHFRTITKTGIYHPYISQSFKVNSFYNYLVSRDNITCCSPELLLFSSNKENIILLDISPDSTDLLNYLKKKHFDIERLAYLKANLLHYELIDLSVVSRLAFFEKSEINNITNTEFNFVVTKSAIEFYKERTLPLDLKNDITDNLQKDKKIVLITLKSNDDKTAKCFSCHSQLRCPNCDKTITVDSSVGDCEYCGNSFTELKCLNCNADNYLIPLYAYNYLTFITKKTFPKLSVLELNKPGYQKLKKLDSSKFDIIVTSKSFINYFSNTFRDDLVFYLINIEPWQLVKHYDINFQIYKYIKTLNQNTTSPISIIKQTNDYNLDLIINQPISEFLKAENENRLLLSAPPQVPSISVVISSSKNFLKVYEFASFLKEKLKRLAKQVFLIQTKTKITNLNYNFVLNLKEILINHKQCLTKIQTIIENENKRKDIQTLIINDLI